MMKFTMGGMDQVTFFIQNHRKIIVWCGFFIFVTLYFLFERPTSGAITAAALLPVMAAGALYGVRYGLLAAVFAFLLCLVLPLATGFMTITESFRQGSAVGGFALLLAGGITGWMQSARSALHLELSRRKLVENALRANEDKLLRITKNLQDMVIYITSKGQILYVNPAVQQHLGYPTEFIIGRSIFEFVHPDELETIKTAFEDILNNNSTRRVEYRCRTAGGDYIWLELVANLFQAEHDGSQQIIFTARNVADQKSKESALRESNATVRALLNSPRDMALLIDKNGIILEINNFAAQQLKSTPQELINQCIYDFATPLSVERRERARQVFNTREPYQTEITFKDTTFELAIYPVFNMLGDVDRLAVFVRDVSTYKNAEQAEREQRRMAEALANSAEVLTGSLDFDQVLDKILENIENVVPFEAVEVMLLHESIVKVVRFINSRGYTTVARLEEGVWLDEIPTLSKVAATHKPLLIPDTHSDPSWVVYPKAEWIASYICAPIEVQGKVAGFLNLFSSQPGFYREIHAHRLHSFADQAAIALQNAQLYQKAQQNAQQLSLLNEITRSAIHAPNRKELFNTLVKSLGGLFNTDGVYISTWDPEQQRVFPAAAAAPYENSYLKIQFPAGEPNLSLEALQAGCVLTVDDTLNSPYTNRTLSKKFPDRSMLAIPLIADERWLGAVLIGYRQHHSITPEEVSLAEQVGSQIALALAKAALIESEQQQRTALSRANQLITLLGQAAARIEASANVDEILSAIGVELSQLGIYCLTALGREPQEGMYYRYISLDVKGIIAAEKLSGISTHGFKFSPDNFPPYHTLIHDQKPVYIPDLIELFKTIIKHAPPGLNEFIIKAVGLETSSACILLPLLVKDQAIGFTGMWGKDLSQEDIPALTLFALQLATALEKARLHDEIQQLSFTDDLCAVYNRRGLFTFGEHEVERAHRFNRPLSILMLDIDLFKQINDQIGHLAGDQVLREVAQCCRDNVRDVDIVGRYGGDEFVVLLIESDRKNALRVAERLRKSIAKLNVSYNITPGLSISCGATMASVDTPNLLSMINQADQALYLAKNQGRNQVYWLD